MQKNLIIVLDFGSQYSHMIARRIRDIGVYTLLCSYKLSVSEILKKNPKGIILSGGPCSTYHHQSPLILKEIFYLNIPILGICYGMQMISSLFKGIVKKSIHKEFGKSCFIIDQKSLLFQNIPRQSNVWMSHMDEVTKVPETFHVIGHTDSCSIAAIQHNKKNIYGVQFHPEVKNTKYGIVLFKNFVLTICQCHPTWILKNFLQKKIYSIRRRVQKNKVLLGISGGLDSCVTACIIYKSVGSSLYCIFIDTGFLLEEDQKNIHDLSKKMNFPIKVIDAKKHFLHQLKGINDPEQKRKIIGKEFIYFFQKESEKIGNVNFLAQGTIYSDIVESSPMGTLRSPIKSHHNVGGLPQRMKFKLIEPLKKLFKDEVKRLGKQLGVPKNILYRHPFPGPGLSIRIIGEVNKRKISILKKSESILSQELQKFGIYHLVSQAFIVLLPIKSVGVMGDKRSYEYVAALRVVNTEDFMTSTCSPLPYQFLEKISNRIINEVDGINRMVYDITSKPPSTIEWE
ncbi:glutamine-hydrolyzing GMP synthase [Blattabacterium cuenoti]|uniref:glutamine-hydrolyzing GMP synthase n=1 Tax=Blattabacterium cuenoti TaxID=1653831 RepID=UPI00163BEB44|nr:glutamine-hydrolyzing GMP synthase [Blattabacterium cuenoti]